MLLAPALPAGAAADPAGDSGPVTVSLAGGDVLYTQADVGILSQSDCGVGRFCIWSLPNYTGNMWQFGSNGSLSSLAATSYYSYWNNRSRVAQLSSTSSGGGSYYCIVPGGKTGYMSGWIVNARSVYLASFQTTC